MTINIISDIHATARTGKALYSVETQTGLDELKSMASDLKRACAAGFIDQATWEKHAAWRQPGIGEMQSFTAFLATLDRIASSSGPELSGLSIDEAVRLARALDAAEDGSAAAAHRAISAKQTAALSEVYDILLVRGFKRSFMETAASFKPELLEPADVLVVAGDLGTMDTYDAVFDDLRRRTAGKFKHVLAVPGNHDHWKTDRCSSSAVKDIYGNWPKLERVVDGVAFIGCTLWTPVPSWASDEVGYSMNDYWFVPGCISPEATSELFREQSAWLKSKAAEHAAAGRKVVVMTHHNPFRELVPEKYKHREDAAVNTAYVVSDGSLDSFPGRENIALWACGHTHECFDGIVQGVHVVRNPIGYGSLQGYSIPENNSGTWYNKIVEI